MDPISRTILGSGCTIWDTHGIILLWPLRVRCTAVFLTGNGHFPGHNWSSRSNFATNELRKRGSSGPLVCRGFECASSDWSAPTSPIAISRTPCARRRGPSWTKTAQTSSACGRRPAASECPRQPRIAISTTRRISLRRSPQKASGSSPRRSRPRRSESDPLRGVGLAYVEFALQKRGLFRLMFGPILVERAKYPELNAAANAVFDLLQRIAVGADERPREDNAAGMAAWGLGSWAVVTVHRRPRARDERKRSSERHSCPKASTGTPTRGLARREGRSGDKWVETGRGHSAKRKTVLRRSAQGR